MHPQAKEVALAADQRCAQQRPLVGVERRQRKAGQRGVGLGARGHEHGQQRRGVERGVVEPPVVRAAAPLYQAAAGHRHGVEREAQGAPQPIGVGAAVEGHHGANDAIVHVAGDERGHVAGAHAQAAGDAANARHTGPLAGRTVRRQRRAV